MIRPFRFLLIAALVVASSLSAIPVSALVSVGEVRVSETRAPADASMSAGMMSGVQDVISSKLGSHYVALAPSLKAIANMDADNAVHREVLGDMALQLGAIKGFEKNLSSAKKSKQVKALLRVMEVNHTESHAAKANSVLTRELEAIKAAVKNGEISDKEARGKISSLSPVWQLGAAFETKRSAEMLKKAKRLAKKLGVGNDFVNLVDASAAKLNDKLSEEDRLPSGVEVKPVLSVGPGQPNVSFREVEKKKRGYQALKPKDLLKLLLGKPIPLIARKEGKKPRQDDHHHELTGLWRMGVEVVPVTITEVVKKNFWPRMVKEMKVWLKDVFGNDISHKQLGDDVRDLGNDPYRGLSGEVRDKGGYEKTSAPDAEFFWALFFYKHIKTKLGPDGEFTVDGFKKAVAEALAWAKNPLAKDLPGYKGPKK